MIPEENPLPEQLFLDFRISDVLDSTKRIPRTEPYASQYCTAISEHRYGDAIFARYHMDGRAENGICTNTRDGCCETYQIPVFDLIMEDARGYARECPGLYRNALRLFNSTSLDDGRRDIIEGLNRVSVGLVCVA
ncbi:hypothetical protein N7466_006180 [Penicillium verhagenii]|uniref:uncharacterized protein n=1 Tax=Penicillium verhagenii TaxID=1562060 RepID=UPI002545616B|nr:uncharacterized protein N7466_006180 [Penicillium verhagenii]KAJ5930687.1 hypothetical protein N7466_006180 [Penicillium verhagenii]